MRNAYRDFLDLIPQHPLEVGDVTAAGAGHVTVTLPGGGVIHARGQATLGQQVQEVSVSITHGSQPL